MNNEQAVEHLMSRHRLTRRHAVSWLNTARRTPSGVYETRSPRGVAVTVTATWTGKRNKEGDKIWEYQIS